MQIYRAEDGEAFQVNKTFWDIENLEYFLHEVTGVEEVAVLAYLSDGRRLRHENLREFGSVADQSIFVFNKYYLDYELEDVLHKLRLDPPLQPEVECDLHHVEDIARTGNTHHDSILHIYNNVHVQHEALRIASTSLDLNVLSISDVFESFAGGARRELEKQAQLLQGFELDLEVIGKIGIHPEFLSSAVRKAVETGEKARTLGDYVSNVKMRQVGEACAKTHKDLFGRFEVVETSMNRLSSGADDIRASIVHSGLVEEAKACLTRSQEALDRITDISTQLQEPRTDEAELLAELWKDDVALRDEVQLISDIKNKATFLCLKALRQISNLNNDLVFLPPTLSTLQVDFRAKTNFAHIQRLHNMLYAYGATLVEIVRRKEFSRFFSQRAQTIAEIMAKLSSSERKRRQIYRGEVHGQLPFDAKGMDDSVPAMEITSTGVTNTSTSYSIERSDIIALLDEVDKIEQLHWVGDDVGTLTHNPLRETRTALERLITRMDSLETTFDKMAEKTIFSASRVSLPRRQATDHTDTEFQEVVEQLHELQDVKNEQERLFEEDRQGFSAEVEHLRNALQEAKAQSSREQDRVDQLEDELHSLQMHNENIAEAHRKLDQLHAKFLADEKVQRSTLADVQAEAVRHAEVADALRQELAQAKSDLEEANQLAMERSAQASAQREQASQALKDASEEAERRLRTQASEADRVLRDIIAEADGDRAVLEHQCFELRGRLGVVERDLTEARSQIDVSNADISGLKEELQRERHELAEARNVEAALRNDFHSAQSALSHCQSQLEESQRLAKALLQVATTFRDSQAKALAASQSSSSSSKSFANIGDSTILPKAVVENPPVDLDDPAGGLQSLQEYDLTSFNETIAKTGSTIRKWQKQCKEYRDRAKGKISFRNFARGDLALFLPTRNSISKPWAAFNVSFPHYFLQANSNLAEQLKVREWVVARITSISERVADNRDPSSNPYGLADGTKFYMLQVEDWTQSSPSTRRKTSPQSPPVIENSPGSPSTVEATPTASKSETPHPVPKHLTPRQRTYSAPVPQPSSLSRLLAQAPPPIEETKERTSPSPPRLSTSRPPSPLAGPPRIRAGSLASPPRSRPSSPLASPPLVSPPSPLAGPSQPRPSSPLTGPAYSRAASPVVSSYVRPASPLTVPSEPRPPSPIAPLTGPSPSPRSVTSPLQAGSRRSSSSSRPSSVFSAGRHPFSLSSSPSTSKKAAATTALSSGEATGVSPPIAVPIPSEDGGSAIPSPEVSPGDGMAGVLNARRRTASTHGSSPLSAATNAASVNALSNLANSWGATFGRKKSVRQAPREASDASAGTSTSTATARPRRSGASDILKRFDDILPQERY